MGPRVDRWNMCLLDTRGVCGVVFFRQAIRKSIHSERMGAVGVLALNWTSRRRIAVDLSFGVHFTYGNFW